MRLVLVVVAQGSLDIKALGIFTHTPSEVTIWSHDDADVAVLVDVTRREQRGCAKSRCEDKLSGIAMNSTTKNRKRLNHA
jgi:hypothetical protein